MKRRFALPSADKPFGRKSSVNDVSPGNADILCAFCRFDGMRAGTPAFPATSNGNFNAHVWVMRRGSLRTYLQFPLFYHTPEPDSKKKLEFYGQINN